METDGNLREGWDKLFGTHTTKSKAPRAGRLRGFLHQPLAQPRSRRLADHSKLIREIHSMATKLSAPRFYSILAVAALFGIGYLVRAFTG